MIFHHKTHVIRSKDVLSNTKLNDMKTIKFPPEKSTYFILRITRILFTNSNAYKMLQGKGRSKIENF